MIMGVLVWPLYSFRFLVFSSVTIDYVRSGKCKSPWLTSSIALLFFRNVKPSMGPVSL